MAKIKVNVKGLKDFQNLLQKMDRASINEAVVKELAARMLAKVVKRTPVGQYHGRVGGTLRRGWTIGNVERSGDVYHVEVVNNVHYAPYVEYGHRTANHQGWVEGQFMMTITEQEIQQDAEYIVEAKIQKLLRRALCDK